MEGRVVRNKEVEKLQEELHDKNVDFVLRLFKIKEAKLSLHEMN